MDDLQLQLPISRVKRICKFDPKQNAISTEVVKLVALAAEKYIAMLGKCAGKWALANARKTVQICDIEQCIRRDWLFAILEDALTDWPEEESAVDDEAGINDAEEENGDEAEEGGRETDHGVESEQSGRDSDEHEREEEESGEREAERVEHIVGGREVEELENVEGSEGGLAN